MKSFECPLKGVVLIQPDVYEDTRGTFMEAWNRKRYEELGIAEEFVQDNVSYSQKSVLRGLHFQNPAAQAKLVSVLRGEIYDVVVDIRTGSPTFAKWHGFLLNDKNRNQVFVPRGFAHGFIVRSDLACLLYKCTAYYDSRSEVSIAWDDSDIAIDWGEANPILSAKDRNALRLKDVPPEKLFRV